MGWAVPTDFMKMALRSMKFNTRYQDFATHFPDTRNPTPETYINYQRACYPAEAIFSERSLGKSLVPIYLNPIMFAHDLCHSQIECFSLRLADPAARRGMLSILIEKTERILRLVGVIAPTPRRTIQPIVNLQSSIPACPV